MNYPIKKTNVLVCCLLSTHSALVLPQDTTSNDTKKQHSTNKLVITGSPMQQKIEGHQTQLDDYDNQVIIDAGDLLTRIAGFSASRAGAHGTDPVLRGQSQTRINLLQQGAFLHGAGPNRMDSPGAYTEPFGWDEVQIIKGVETLTLGSGGTAGSINFKRLKPQLSESPQGKAMLAYSPDFYKAGIDMSAGSQQGYFRLISQIIDQDSYQDGDGQTTRTAFKTLTNTLITGYTPNNEDELRLSIMANRGSDALFAGTMMDGPTTDMDAIQLLYLQGDQLGNRFSEYQVYWNDAHHVMDNYSLRQQTAPMRMLTDAKATTTGAKWLTHWETGQWIWQTSADWQNVQRQADRFMGMVGTPVNLQATIWPDNELDIKGVALDAEYQFSQKTRLKSGVRFDRIEASANALNTTIGQALYQVYYPQTPASRKESNWSGFSRFYHQTEQGLYWLGLSSVVRTADATERYVGAANMIPMMRWVGNPDISPERHNQLEAGAKWPLSKGWVELSIYHNNVNDFILRDRARMQPSIIVMDMATIYRNVDATLNGLELSTRYSLTENWHLHGNLAYVKGTHSNDDQPLYQIPPIEGLLQINYEQPNITYWLDVRFAREQNDVDDNMMQGSALDAGESDSWTALDFKLRYDLANDWQLSAGINNLLDTTYAYHVSRANSDPFNPQAVRVNEPGRQIWGSILYRF